MERRAFLLSVGGATTVTSGCLGTAFGGTTETPDGPIVERSFEILSRNPADNVDGAPSVAFDAANHRVVITGKMWKGNPCYTAALRDVTYDSSTDKLSVLVGVRRDKSLWERVSGCPDSLGSVQYEVVVEFRETLPATVTATEKPPKAFEPQTTTARNPDSTR